MLFCPKCGTRNKTTYNFCRRCGTKIKHSMDFEPPKQEVFENKINKFITLKLENNKTVIYIKGEKFIQCKYLLIEIPAESIEKFDDFLSIDDVSESLDHSFERNNNLFQIKPEIEFWGHSSNLQAWSENFYDTNLLHSNLAFPLLKRLTDVGDPVARRVFKDEIAERLTSGSTNVSQYLIQENYLEYFDKEELGLLMEIFFEQIEKEFKQKQDSLIANIEIEALLNIIKCNIANSKTFLLNRLKPVDSINKETHLGFLLKENHITAVGFNRCGLKTLPSSIGNLEHLSELYMTENRLGNLPESIGNLIHLKILNLSENHLIELPNEIGNLINLKELYLNHNIIQFLPESMIKLSNLEIISIWGNQLRKLPDNLNKLDSLKVLGLSFNQLEKFPNLSSSFRNLENLDLSNNKIKTIPETVSNLKSLKFLWLNNNPIDTVTESLFDLQSLSDLYIINTPLASKRDIEVDNIFKRLEAKGVIIWK